MTLNDTACTEMNIAQVIGDIHRIRAVSGYMSTERKCNMCSPLTGVLG